MMKPRSLAAACSLLLLSAAVYAHAAGGAATASKASSAAAKPAVTPIIDWLEANTGIKVAAVPSKPATVGVAAVNAAAKPQDYSEKVKLCFKETQRCGDYSYETQGDYFDATAYYMSYLGCSEHDEPHYQYNRRYSESVDDIFGLGGIPGDARADAVGSCFVDVYGTSVPVLSGVTVGHAQMTCDITDSPKCGIEGCNGATISMGVGKAYAVKQAISFQRAQRPATCPELTGIARRSGGSRSASKSPSSIATPPGSTGTPSSSSNVGSFFLSTGGSSNNHAAPRAHNQGNSGVSSMFLGGMAAADAQAKIQAAPATAGAAGAATASGAESKVQTASVAGTAQYYGDDDEDEDRKYVCVGPAVVVSGPVSVDSKHGETAYKSGWVTYESFLYPEIGEGSVQCGQLYSNYRHLGLPVIEPNTYTFTMDEKHHGPYSS